MLALAGSGSAEHAAPRDLWAGGRGPRAPPEKGLELDACCGAEGRAWGGSYLLVPGSCGLQGAGMEGAGGRAARESVPARSCTGWSE